MARGKKKVNVPDIIGDAIIGGAEQVARNVVPGLVGEGIRVLTGGKPRTRHGRRTDVGGKPANGPGQSLAPVGIQSGGMASTERTVLAKPKGKAKPARKEGGGAGAFEAFTSTDALERRATAAEYCSQLLGNDVANPVGVPDGLPVRTETFEAVYSYTAYPYAQLTTGIRYMGVFYTPTVDPDVDPTNKPVRLLTQIDSSGNLTWTATAVPSAVLTAAAQQSASLRTVAMSVGLENSSAMEVRGGYALTGTWGSTTPPTTVSSILLNQDMFERIDVSKSTPGQVIETGWIPRNATELAMQAPTFSSFNSGILIFVRLPNYQSGVTPGDWEVFNWVFNKTVQMEPAVAGVLTAYGSEATDDCRVEVSAFKDMIQAKTGVVMSNQFVPGSGKWLSDAWIKARRFARTVADGYTTALGIARAAAPYVTGIASLMGAHPDDLAEHYAAVATKRESPLVAAILASHRGDDRWGQEGIARYCAAVAHRDAPRPTLLEQQQQAVAAARSVAAGAVDDVERDDDSLYLVEQSPARSQQASRNAVEVQKGRTTR